jgi:hypothetical protein
VNRRGFLGALALSTALLVSGLRPKALVGGAVHRFKGTIASMHEAVGEFRYENGWESLKEIRLSPSSFETFYDLLTPRGRFIKTAESRVHLMGFGGVVLPDESVPDDCMVIE